MRSRVLDDILITGTGLFTPENSVTNAELVESLGRANERWNAEHKAEIESGEIQSLREGEANDGA